MFARTGLVYVSMCALGLVLLLTGYALAQTTSGTISGTVVDQSSAVVPGAAVTIVDEKSGVTRTTESNDSGAFVFAAVPPATYTVIIEKSGFRTLRRTGVVLTTMARLGLGAVELTVGELKDTVTVDVKAELVTTENAQKDAELSSTQLESLTVRGRDAMNILKVLPGVSQMLRNSGASEVAEDDPLLGNQAVSGAWGSLTPNISGNRSWMNNALLDGQSANDTGWVGSYQSPLALDAISEVKIVLNNYQAEYGRNGGPTINVISRGGGSNFHGTLWWYKRHEKTVANDFFRNRSGTPKPITRTTNAGFTVGGPIYIPNKWNTNKDKLFFFYSYDEWRIRVPGSISRFTVPTALERNGDFSQTLDQNAVLIPVIDPLTGVQFSRNIVPGNRINSAGQQLLSMLPMPNRLDRSETQGAYNFEFSDDYEIPKRYQQLKIDFNPTEKDRISIRPRMGWTDTRSFTGIVGFSGIPMLKERGHYYAPHEEVSVSYTRIVSPTAVNEFTVGIQGFKEQTQPRTPTNFDGVLRSKVGLNLAQLYPENNPLGIIPAFSYGGVPNGASFSIDGRNPQTGSDERFSLGDNFTLTRANHTFKFGFFMESTWSSEGKRASPSGGFSGDFNFSRDPNNPGDANWPFATAILGNFQLYRESNTRTRDIWKSNVVEWFAQDTWKATRRLTVNFGARFSWFTPWFPVLDGVAASFSPDRYDPTNAPAFFQPVLDSGGNRVAQDPLTGDLHPALFIGAFVPGSGDPANGMVLYNDPSYPRGFVDQQPVQVQPRLGFAYDLTGDGKTAIRGGFGTSKQTVPGTSTFIWGTVTAPPLQYSPQIYYGDIDTLPGASGVLFPSGVTGMEKSPVTPSVYNYSLGIQREIGFRTVLDVSYVGNVGRHLLQTVDPNRVPYGAHFDAANQDPTTGRALPDNFYRPYPGHAGLTFIEWSGISNYNSLQVTANRRFANGLLFGISYTYSKTMDLTSNEWGTLPTYVDRRTWNYGLANFDQTHMFVANYLWKIPNPSSKWNNVAIRAVFDNWTFSGTTTFASGAPRHSKLQYDRQC